MTFVRYGYVYALIVVATTYRVNAQIQATTPGPNETYTAGSPCKVAWNVDTSGTWKDMTINLMSGPNNNMSLVTNVATGVDGTDKSVTPYSWTCPEVDPYSNIYFYQFSDGNNASSNVWTTRFTIASPSNQTADPEHATQPDGQAVPWGIGQVKAANSTGSHTSSAHTSSALPSSNSAMTVPAPPPSSTASSKQGHNRHAHDDGSDVSNGGYMPDDSGSQPIEGSYGHEDGNHGHDHKDHDAGNEGSDETRSASAATANRKSNGASATASGNEDQASNKPDAGGGGRTIAKAGGESASNSAAGKAGAIGSDALSRAVRAAVPSYTTLYSLFALLSALAAL